MNRIMDVDVTTARAVVESRIEMLRGYNDPALEQLIKALLVLAVSDGLSVPCAESYEDELVSRIAQPAGLKRRRK